MDAESHFLRTFDWTVPRDHFNRLCFRLWAFLLRLREIHGCHWGRIGLHCPLVSLPEVAFWGIPCFGVSQRDFYAPFLEISGTISRCVSVIIINKTFSSIASIYKFTQQHNVK